LEFPDALTILGVAVVERSEPTGAADSPFNENAIMARNLGQTGRIGQLGNDE
jgi:hypothetical protein